MPRIQDFIRIAILAITTGLSSTAVAGDTVPFETAKAIGRRVAWSAALPGGQVQHAEEVGSQFFVLDAKICCDGRRDVVRRFGEFLHVLYQYSYASRFIFLCLLMHVFHYLCMHLCLELML